MAVLRQESEICRLKKGDRVGLIACSDARPDSDREKIGKLCGILRNAEISSSEKTGRLLRRRSGPGN